jgi:hypothetical protein
VVAGWVTTLAVCRWCFAVWAAVFPLGCYALECPDCGRRTETQGFIGVLADGLVA